ncbi:hypothetical protein LEP1GSC058_0202 [Leptospira fainei serovar Hurstbridge str. BUT 6]|uniref:Uncharacterized protein n=1 Tax=Leptospira fainei serovar Hurstbridge str. BUT 6 TaxID=1193011 RepID=S3VWC6_9LEPT|nr:hypothetical protein [Leptospira fainei]EPG72427.1 hypothetical protein LEP1GSC058_0202 [Leptospira fainei serovar Hurstbridge str. BUT 6]
MEYQEIIGKAESSVSKVADPKLKEVAFGIMLKHLLSGDDVEVDPEGIPRVKGKKANAKSKKANGQKPASSSSSKKLGPKARLDELVDENYFKQPRNMSNMLEILSERGVIYKQSDLTRPLDALMAEKKLRRKKMKVGQSSKENWFYTNW